MGNGDLDLVGGHSERWRERGETVFFQAFIPLCLLSKFFWLSFSCLMKDDNSEISLEGKEKKLPQSLQCTFEIVMMMVIPQVVKKFEIGNVFLRC